MKSPGGKVGVSGSPNWEQKLALCGVFWAFEGHHRKQISLGADGTHWVSLSTITGATGITPATPKEEADRWSAGISKFLKLQRLCFLPVSLW